MKTIIEVYGNIKDLMEAARTGALSTPCDENEPHEVSEIQESMDPNYRFVFFIEKEPPGCLFDIDCEEDDEVLVQTVIL